MAQQPISQGMVQRIARHLGALPARRVTWGLVGVFSLWALLDVFVFKLSGGLAKSSFDAMVRARVFAASPDPRIVIIDIDEASLARMAREFGRWPWPHSHFSVVRLPGALDAASQITQAALPGLWLAAQPAALAATSASASSAPPATVALIPPALPAIAASRLGFNNGYVDSDGVLRRYRFAEPLADGSAIQSIAMSVLNATNKEAYYAQSTRARGIFDGKTDKDGLIAWRKHANAYPHVSFADVFAQAEGGKPLAALPVLAGKVVIIGSTAPSLHDIHPTPLSPTMAGVDSLATALDNGLNQRHLRELPPAVQAGFAVALCAGLALWVQFKSVASLAPALLALPAALLAACRT